MSVDELQGMVQIEPTIGPSKVRECRWKPSFELVIPKDWVSGVYLGKLIAAESNIQSYVIFIVRDNRKAGFLFQCSDLTWHAYNRWPGWSSLYDYKDNHWSTGKSNDISFDRPYSRFVNMTAVKWENAKPYVGSGSYLFCEFPLSFWLEKNGYDVSYISNLDTHRDFKGLMRAKAFISVGHDEYWSQQMSDNITKARDEGLSLAFLSGNTMVAEVDIKPDTQGRADRIFRRGKYRDNEQEILGGAACGRGFADWICTEPDHWVYEGTGMKKGDRIQDLIGWEYQGPPLRKDPNMVVLARGKVTEPDDDAESDEYVASVYEGPKGNIVFNASSIWWSMPLSSPPGFLNPHRVKADFTKDDPRVQRMTKNVLERMLKESKRKVDTNGQRL